MIENLRRPNFSSLPLVLRSHSVFNVAKKQFILVPTRSQTKIKKVFSSPMKHHHSPSLSLFNAFLTYQLMQSRILKHYFGAFYLFMCLSLSSPRFLIRERGGSLMASTVLWNNSGRVYLTTQKEALDKGKNNWFNLYTIMNSWCMTCNSNQHHLDMWSSVESLKRDDVKKKMLS